MCFSALHGYFVRPSYHAYVWYVLVPLSFVSLQHWAFHALLFVYTSVPSGILVAIDPWGLVLATSMLQLQHAQGHAWQRLLLCPF
jgi:hypothetical protein